MAEKALIGDSEVIRRIRKMPERAVAALGPVVRTVAVQVGDLANASVPRDRGVLASSAFVDGPELTPNAAAAHVGYTEEVAPFVHEGFHYGRKTAEPPKWLEKAADALRDNLAPAAAQALRSALKG